MKKVFFYFVSFLVWTSLVLAQVPADQQTIIIEGGPDNIGSLENAVNGDTLAGGVRVNPNRIYLLKKDVIYYSQASILFGGDNDTTSTLNIIGETGGKLPIILSIPKDGGDQFVHQIHGNFTIKNVYWPAQSVTKRPNLLFSMHRNGRRLIMENVITEFAGGDLINGSDHNDKIYLKNCYFRDMNWFTSSWNSCFVFSNVDTAWVENCTFSNSGLGLLFTGATKFMYFNHNTMVNFAKYGIPKYQYEEAYFTNNMFMNLNWEGECQGTWYTQTDDHQFKGVADIDTINENSEHYWMTGFGYVPKQEDVKYINSNNVHFTDPLMYKYYQGDFTPGYDYPISNRNWAPNSNPIPLRVENIPPCYLSQMTIGLAQAYPNIIIDSAYIYDEVDPQMHTPAVRGEDVLAAMVRFSQSNYGYLPEGVTYTEADRATISFGDYDPTTIPGVESEDGDGFTKISDLLEDFSYDANIASNIDGKKLGALHWWDGGLDGWDSQAQFEKVKKYYADKLLGTGVEVSNNNLPSAYKLAQNYPNPFNPTTNINFSIPVQSKVKIAVYDVLGNEVSLLVNNELGAGNYNVTWDATNFTSGIYFYTISTPSFSSTKKMTLIK